MRAAILIVVLGLVAFASGLKVYNQNDAFTLSCCGSKSFDTTTSFCCIDTVYKNSDSDSNQCCGNKRLGNDQQCCVAAADGTLSLSDKAISSSLTCCGTTGYDQSTQLCCSANHVLSNKNGNLACCGNDRTYDPSSDLCCFTTDVKSDSCSDASVSVNYNVISNGASNNKQCCGSGSYDSSTQLCCGGTDSAHVISNNNNALQCCGTSSFDASKQSCCQTSTSNDYTVDGVTITVTTSNGKVFNSANLQCCDDGSLNAFDPSTEFCCAGGNVVKQNSDNSLACCGSRSYNQNTQTCCSREVASFKKVNGCCGGCTTYAAVTSTEYTIGSPANAGCCDNKPFDENKSFCCGNNLYSQNNDNSLSCCGDKSYDSSNDLCCSDDTLTHNSVFKNKANTDISYDCCLNIDASDECNIKYNFAIFDTSKQSCPCGKVLDQSNDLSLNNNDPNVQAGCCGTTQIDVNSKTCCSKAIYDIDPAIGLACCADDGKTLYNPGYQVCCPTPSAGCPSAPCGFKQTRDVEEVEEVEEVEASKKTKKTTKKKNSSSNKNKVQCGDTCCGNTGFFTKYQKCCDGKILDYNGSADGSSPMTCCGDEIYNTNFRKCCTESNLKSSNSCGKTYTVSHAIFDADSEICCGTGAIVVA